ncbi:hypothetical protein [Microbispora sp. KK1-11]|uniref:hypothetical protein n=1 Tax=Microbispora sp. KK1-11 TaxID=2053005 RepID=UPI0011593371|nr:hypothetical protein [Microbispora sp. KK1-11]TQS29250.1 hypothetical protein FLW16_09485 [Microbispora sp. KK1-11]
MKTRSPALAALSAVAILAVLVAAAAASAETTSQASALPARGITTLSFRGTNQGLTPVVFGDRAGSRGLRQVGRGHTAKYVTWPDHCVRA